MNRNNLAIVIIISFSILLLLLFVKRTQIRRAFFTIIVAQLFSWPITLVYALFGLQINPVRFFPHATDSNFLFAFIFYPAFFTVYYLFYPRKSRILIRFLYSVIMTALPLLIQLLTDLFTDLIYYPDKLVLLESLLFIMAIYYVARKYIDWFFSKSLTFWRNS